MSDEQNQYISDVQEDPEIEHVIVDDDDDDDFVRISGPKAVSQGETVPKQAEPSSPKKRGKQFSAKTSKKTFSSSPPPSLKAKKKVQEQAEQQVAADTASLEKHSSAEDTSKKVLIGVIAAVVLLIVIIVGLLFYKSLSDKEKARLAEKAEAAEKERILDERRQQRLADAIKYSQKMPLEEEEQYQKMVGKFKHIIKAYRGTEYVQKAEAELEKLKQRKEEKKRLGIEGLRKEAAPYIAKGDFNSAMTIYSQYPADFHDQTMKERRQLIKELKAIIVKAEEEKAEAARKARQQAAEHARRREKAFFNQTATLIFAGKYADAQNKIKGYSKDKKYLSVLNLLTELEAMDAEVMKYFKGKIGKREIPLEIKGKKAIVKIKKVAGDTVQGFKISSKVSTGIKFSLKDVSINNKLKIIKNTKTSEAAKAAFIIVSAVQQKKYNTAKKYLDKAGPLAPILRERLSQLK